MVATPTVVIRTDASLEIGNGHVMRCLALAGALRQRGAFCQFISRAYPGHLADQITAEGFDAALLKAPKVEAGSGLEQDAAETRDVIVKQPDWVVVDHYALDYRWHRALRVGPTRLFVIDDLADRLHVADLLLDQNLGRLAADYDRLVPMECRRLIGPTYALLRPEFSRRRKSVLARRQTRGIAHIMISMGGTDTGDATASVLRVLAGIDLPGDMRITVVMGSRTPTLVHVTDLAAQMPWRTEVLVDVRDMAGLMANADLAIGAGGGTSWERCCLGLPSLILVLAPNQRPGAVALADAGAALLLGEIGNDGWKVRLTDFLNSRDLSINLEGMSFRARSVTDGCGCDRVAAEMLEQGV
jgi:UDP-2,4-diacetamido-2,4,6-trideoxy-beta-L-altropyranose hydrolase